MIAEEPKKYYDNPRIPNFYKSGRVVIVTQKEKPVLMAKSSITNTTEVREFPLNPLNEDEVKDTSGAGDALIGGFLALYIDGHELEYCLKCGIYCATECLKVTGCTLPKKMGFQT